VYALPGAGGETVMQGLDSLSIRCAEYRNAGARFAKWRSPLEIRDGQITRLAIESNMKVRLRA
jgi:fructose-bisphosphate aldolase class I